MTDMRKPDGRRRVATGREKLPLEKIISGGQTGADRASLDFALAHGVSHSGWCPRGRRAEDGTLERHYALRETPDTNYSQRTEWNVRDSDGTLIFTVACELSGGSALTQELAEAHGKPCLRLSEMADGDAAPASLTGRNSWAG
jgi:hypothetical protein